ncbi:hypothetical protein ACF07T_39980 [Streptomyces sp. NPDC015184]|uniref:hypothetical protein n=1 Tax=Streptomyces sp. NPDC015184 TaxID=3364946 RepID=UPI0036FE564C
MKDTHAHRAARGAAIVRIHLCEAPTHQSTEDRVLRGLHYANEVHTTTADPAYEGTVALRDALADVLHHVDGWHTPDTILDSALLAIEKLPAGWAEKYRDYQTAPTARPMQVTTVTDTRERSAVVGAVTEILMAAAHYGETATVLADAAEERFRDEAESARFAAMRAARK